MPPCGFNPSSVRGGLAFVRGCYEDLLDQVRSGKFTLYDEAIEFELRQIDTALSQLHVDESGKVNGFNTSSVPGALTFIQGCYEDLLHQVKARKFATYEEAIEFELQQLETALSQLHIDESGKVISRSS